MEKAVFGGMKMNTLVLDNLSIYKNKITYSFSLEGEWKRYFKNRRNYELIYDFDLKGLPNSIASIPFVLNMMPMVWLFDAEFYVEELDENLMMSLKEIKKSYENMYPYLSFKGKLTAKNIEKNRYIGQRAGLFFSGGLDAVSTLASHYSENPLLINIQGSDLSLNYVKALKGVRSMLSGVAESLDLDITFIKSGFRRIIDEKKVTAKFYSQTKDNYWHGFQHGIAIIGHAAPIAYLKKLKMIYIAASYTEESWVPCASEPTIDNKVLLASTTIFHDGYEYDRNAKSENVINFINKTKKKIALRVCYEDYRITNCCRCEKCYRTSMNFIAKGFDIEKIGFKLNNKDFKKMEYALKNRIIFTRSDSAYWTTIQNEFLKHPELKNDERLRWIYSLDIKNINNNWKKKPLSFVHKYLRRVKKVCVLIDNIFYGMVNKEC